MTTCVFPVNKHKGSPQKITRFTIPAPDIVYVMDHESNKWMRFFGMLSRHACCSDLLWVEKDYMPGNWIRDLTSDRCEP